MDAAEFDEWVADAVAIDVVQYNEDTRATIQAADLVVGVDAARRLWAFFSGQERLREIAAGDQSAELRVVSVALDSEMTDVEYLCAAVEVLKGKHEYEGGFVHVPADTDEQA